MLLIYVGTNIFLLLSFYASLPSSPLHFLHLTCFLIIYCIHVLIIAIVLFSSFSCFLSTIVWFIPQKPHNFCWLWLKSHFYFCQQNSRPHLCYDLSKHLIRHPIWFLLPTLPIPTLFQTPIHGWLLYGLAWQGTDLMHNHVLADTSLTSAALPGNPPCSDQSEDSDYDSIWTATSYRTGSFSRKIRCQKQLTC